jgi:hypothetical protein
MFDCSHALIKALMVCLEEAPLNRSRITTNVVKLSIAYIKADISACPRVLFWFRFRCKRPLSFLTALCCVSRQINVQTRDLNKWTFSHFYTMNFTQINAWKHSGRYMYNFVYFSKLCTSLQRVFTCGVWFSEYRAIISWSRTNQLISVMEMTYDSSGVRSKSLFIIKRRNSCFKKVICLRIHFLCLKALLICEAISKNSVITPYILKIWGLHGADFEDYCVLVSDTV